MKKVIFLLVLGLLLVGGVSAIYLVNKVNTKTEDDYSLKSGYKLFTNDQFGYRFQFDETLVNDVKPADNNFKVLAGNSIHGVSTRVYEIPEVNIYVYDRSVLLGKSLEDWVKSVSTKNPEDLSNNHNLKYVSDNYSVVDSNKIIFLVNSNPILNFSEPVLLIDNGQYLYQLSGYSVSSEKVLDLASSFQVKFNNTFKGLSNDDLNSIKVYFNNNEKF